jgi:transketolase
MRHDPADPWNPAADRLVLSEGHAVPIVYAAWADLGGLVGKSRAQATALKPADVDTLRARDSVLDGHPNPAEGFPFFDAATGSLGMGLSVAAGLASAARVDNNDRRIYCIIGDGESREGQVWEAADYIVDHQLNNVCAIFNANDQGQADYVSAQQKADALAAKLRAFNWEVVEIDGHDLTAVRDALAKTGSTDKPLGIVARTIKGWGVESLQKGNWHGKPLPESELEAAYADLDKYAADTADADIRPPAPAAAPKAKRLDPREAKWPTFEEAMESAGLLDTLKSKGKLATRRAYGAALQIAGSLVPQVVALDGDVSNSTFANMFAKAYPDRFFECKIAEQNMISAAAGMSAAGFIPFVNSFAKFIARGYDQVEMANISRANIKIVGSHSGVSLAADGPSQMGLLDVAFFQSFASVRGDDRETPLCRFWHPADAISAYRMVKHMVAEKGMAYMRTHRPDVPLLYKEDASFAPGGCNVIAPGDDLALVGSGYMVHEALQARDLLARQNIRATVIDAYTLPLDPEKLLDAIQRAGNLVLTVEDNYGGGVSAVVAQIVAHAGQGRAEALHVQRIPKSTLTPDEALAYAGVSANQIADHALAMVKRA